jgi:hypothetical protein
MTIMQDIESGTGEVADWFQRNLPKYEAIEGEVPTLEAIIEDAATEIESSDNMAAKSLDVFKDIGKIIPLIAAVMKANPTPIPGDTIAGAGAA